MSRVRVQVLAHVHGPDTFPLFGLGGFRLEVRLELHVLVGLVEGVPGGRLRLRLVGLIERIRGVVIVEGIIVILLL